LSFGAAASRLGSLVKGVFRGIEVLKRGASPRIVSAEVLGSRGATRVSGPELEWRLGLSSAWAFFSVKRGSSVAREPDLSGRTPTSGEPLGTEAAPATTPAPPQTVPTAPQGGAPAPGAITSSASTGGVAAG
jgi:hypothetical protein